MAASLVGHMAPQEQRRPEGSRPHLRCRGVTPFPLSETLGGPNLLEIPYQ